MFQPATLQIFLKFPAHEPRQSASFRLDLSEEVWVVVVNDSIEKRLFGPVACLLRPAR
jgi:hypothetical protein